MFTLRYRLGKLILLQVFAGVADTGNKLSSVLLLPVINYRWCRCYRPLIIAIAVVTGDKLSLVPLLPAFNYR